MILAFLSALVTLHAGQCDHWTLCSGLIVFLHIPSLWTGFWPYTPPPVNPQLLLPSQSMDSCMRIPLFLLPHSSLFSQQAWKFMRGRGLCSCHFMPLPHHPCHFGLSHLSHSWPPPPSFSSTLQAPDPSFYLCTSLSLCGLWAFPGFIEIAVNEVEGLCAHDT